MWIVPGFSEQVIYWLLRDLEDDRICSRLKYFAPKCGFDIASVVED